MLLKDVCKASDCNLLKEFAIESELSLSTRFNSRLYLFCAAAGIAKKKITGIIV